MQAGIEIRCPKCYSAKVAVHKNGAAPSVADHIALLEGTVDGDGIMFQCQQCGALFASSEARMARTDNYETATPAIGTAALQPNEQQIANMCKQEGALTAIKYIRDTYGWELKEAKDFVDKVTGLNPPAQGAYTQPADEAMVIKIVQEQGKLHAIKYVKDHHNLGLKEAKDYVDSLLSGKGIVPAGGKTGCFIATACYGDYDAPEVKVLRLYRDQVMAHSRRGRVATRLYYALSPGLAALISKSPRAQRFIRTYLLQGLVQRLSKTRS